MLVISMLPPRRGDLAGEVPNAFSHRQSHSSQKEQVSCFQFATLLLR
jgi:hypothetical protein